MIVKEQETITFGVVVEKLLEFLGVNSSPISNIQRRAIQRQLEPLQKEMKKKQLQIERQHVHIEILKKKVSTKNDQIEILKQEVSRQNEQIERSKKELSRRNELIQISKKELSRRNEQIQRLTSIQMNSHYLRGQVIGSNQNQQQANNLNRQLQIENDRLTKSNKNLITQLQQKDSLLEIASQDKNNLLAQIEKLKQQFWVFQEKEKRFQLRQEEIYDQNLKHLTHVYQMSKQIQWLNSSLERSNDETKQAQCQAWRLRSLVHKIKNQRLFQKSIFLDQTQKQELVTAIRFQAQDPLESTKSLYFSSCNNINVSVLQLKENHSYAFVAKTFNGKYIAAVSLHLPKKLLEALRQNRDFIIDLDEARNFFLKEGRSALFQIRDDDLIFGDNDLKVEMKDFRISTKLGQEDSNFVLPHWEAGIFGVSDPVFDIESFQVFELFLTGDHVN